MFCKKNNYKKLKVIARKQSTALEIICEIIWNLCPIIETLVKSVNLGQYKKRTWSNDVGLNVCCPIFTRQMSIDSKYIIETYNLKMVTFGRDTCIQKSKTGLKVDTFFTFQLYCVFSPEHCRLCHLQISYSIVI